MKKYILLVLLILLLFYLFRGPLFPWNPLKTRYRTVHTRICDIYIKNYSSEDVNLNKIDEIIKEEEIWHDLKYKKRFKLIILDQGSSMKRFLPWLTGEGYSVCIGYLNLIYIGANARKSEYGQEVFIRHELSHLLLLQNTSSYKASLEIRDQGWFNEGIAICYGGPQFFSISEFASVCQAKDVKFTSLNEVDIRDVPACNIRIIYAYYGYFIRFLIEEYGLQKLQAYIKQYLINPAEYRKIFPVIYQDDLNTLLVKFKQYIYD